MARYLSHPGPGLEEDVKKLEGIPPKCVGEKFVDGPKPRFPCKMENCGRIAVAAGDAVCIVGDSETP